MKISSIHFENFRIYRGHNEVLFTPDAKRSISIIAGKNGFGKTTFLTSLIWVFYGRMMGEVEEKYKKDIRSAGGYDNYLVSLLNRDVRAAFDSGENVSPVVSVRLETT